MQVQSIKLGGHPEYTRLIIGLSKPAPYKVRADFLKKKVRLVLTNATLSPTAKSRDLKDKNLRQVLARQITPQKVEITLLLNNPNNRFFHFLKKQPAQIVVDLKGDKKPFIQTQIASKEKTQTTEKPKSSKKIKIKKAKRIKIPGIPVKQVEEILTRDNEEKVKNGWEDYQKALQVYQTQRYEDALVLFDNMRKKFPNSIYLENIAYLAAEAEFKIAFEEENPFYDRALDSYKFATREYPDSNFRDYADFKIAFIYDLMKLRLEAKSHYEQGLKSRPKSRFTPIREVLVALLLIKEKKFEEALAAFHTILKKSPKHPDLKKALFQIAKWYYDQEDFPQAIKIYEDAARRWPLRLNEDPEINYNMGDIYFRQKKFDLARKHYFDLINLAPETQLAHRGLNRIGDSYLLEEKDFAALSVFHESAHRNPGGRESQYANIRLADIGIRNPNLPTRDIIFDVQPYYHPFKAYEDILKEAADKGILAEASLSRGVALLQDQRYLESINQLKDVLALKPNKRTTAAAKKYIQQAMIHLVDRYYLQDGTLPILYAYTDYVSLPVEPLSNAKTLLQIGESFQSVGMVQEAVEHYEKVKELDVNKRFSDRLFLNLGRIHLDKKNFTNAERVAKTFLNRYPKSPLAPKGMKLLADAYRGQGKSSKAIKTYRKLLKKDVEDPSEIHYLIGEVSFDKNDIPQAIQGYQKSIESYDRKILPVPQHIPNAYYKLGSLLYTKKNYKQAIKALDRARSLYPKHPDKPWSDYLIAESYAQLKEKDQASEEFNDIMTSERTDGVMRKAAELKLKLMEWENQFKDFL